MARSMTVVAVISRTGKRPEAAAFLPCHFPAFPGDSVQGEVYNRDRSPLPTLPVSQGLEGGRGHTGEVPGAQRPFVCYILSSEHLHSTKRWGGKLPEHGVDSAHMGAIKK